MEHKAQLENKKYRNWVRAGLGIKYVKEGLEPFCDHIVKQQHISILDKVKRKHNLSTVSCGLCDVSTLQPNHVQTKTRQCPLGQMHCNCQQPRGKFVCRNMVCGAIYDEIIQLHASTPPAPNWRNTDAKQWCTEPWAVAKCFINAPGYEQKITAAEFDCTGLLHVLLNNIDFQQHINCVITGTDVFSRVRKTRNDIFHSDNMELEDSEVYSYIDDMIKQLQDDKKIKHRQESEDAVKKLQELKQENFIISTTDETEICRVAMAAINVKENEFKQTITDADNKLKATAYEEKHGIEEKGHNIRQDLEKKEAEFEQTGQKIAQDLVLKGAELEQTGKKIKQDLVTKEAELVQTGHNMRQVWLTKEAELEQTGQKIRQELVTKAAELVQTGQNIRQDLVMKEATLEQTGQTIRQELVMKKAEIDQIGQHIQRNLVINEEESKMKIEQKVIDIEKKLTRKEIEATEKIEHQLQESRLQLEGHKNLIERSMTNSTETRKDVLASKEKKDFQKKLIKLYKKYLCMTSALPLNPEKADIDVYDIYVPPLMTVDIKDNNSKECKEAHISMEGIFEIKEEPEKAIYIIGEAGSGKTMLCKNLVRFWCIAHSYPECSLDESEIVKTMTRFNFLFYVSLRNTYDCSSIEEMLEILYNDPALGDILQNESDTCLIVLDGLDEWAPEGKQNSAFLTSGLPGRKLDADYTIITTSRQWKFDSLRIKDTEVDKKISLKGIDGHEIDELTDKTVKKLNKTFLKRKNKEDCKNVIQRSLFSDIIKIPLILQQLICLWFEDKLHDISKCDINSSMLALFLEWKTLKTSEVQECKMVIQECMVDSSLPGHLCDFETFYENTCAIQYLSRLAYETLFNTNKENRLSFRKLILKRLKIPNDIITYCLNAGVLRKEHNISLHESVRQQMSFSFFHKSMQEYLAAVYIASEFQKMLKLRESLSARDISKQCAEKYFSSCETVVDILDQSNVLTMLCGFEPRLLLNVSGYIYNVSLVDQIVVEKRNKMTEQYSLDTNSKWIIDIQACIFNCIEEVLTSTQFESFHSHAYIADLYVSYSTDLLRYCHNIILNNVRLVEIVDNPYRSDKDDKEAFYLAVKHLTKCDQFKIIRFVANNKSDERIYNEFTTILAKNVNTIETVSLFNINEIMASRLVSKLPKILLLTSLQVNVYVGGSVQHNVMLSLGKFLNKKTRLQHISLAIICEKFDTHMIDLSKHKQLQHVDFMRSSFCVVSCNTANLETCMLSITNVDMMNQVCNSLCKAGKLKQLSLYDGSGLRYNETECRNTTENLIRLLPSLVSLSTLELNHFTLTDNIIVSPSDMNLKEIILNGVTLSMTTWCKFVDCLPVFPQEVKVTADCMDITDELFRSRMHDGFGLMRDENQVVDAKQFVKEKTTLFHVPKDDYNFQFTTKKT